MPIEIIFYLVFFGQIFLISHYYPRKLIARESHILRTYPPETHPKLYPESAGIYQTLIHRFSTMFYGLFALGLVLALLIFLYPSATGGLTNDLITFYFVIQFSPLMVMEFRALKTFKLMRKANLSSTRTAELSPRNMFNFVSPSIALLAVITFLTLNILVIYMIQSGLYVGDAAYNKLVSASVSNLLFAGIIYWNIRSKKQNPHQSHRDHMRMIKLAVTQLFLIAISRDIYMIVDTLVDASNFADLQAIVTCLYLQFLAVICFRGLHLFHVDDIDFDAYRSGIRAS